MSVLRKKEIGPKKKRVQKLIYLKGTCLFRNDTVPTGFTNIDCIIDTSVKSKTEVQI